MSNTLDEIMNSLKEMHIICPSPYYWRIIPRILRQNNKKNIQIKEIIMGYGWHTTSDAELSERFFYHLSIAQELEVLDEVKQYLDELLPFAWRAFHFAKGQEPEPPREELERMWQFVRQGSSILASIKVHRPEIMDESDVPLSKELYLLIKEHQNMSISDAKNKKNDQKLSQLITSFLNIFETQKLSPEGKKDLRQFCDKVVTNSLREERTEQFFRIVQKVRSSK